MRKLLFIFCVSFFPVCLFGQDLRKIKEDPSYLWGAGTGQDYESRQASAVDALIHKLSSAHLIDLPAGHELAVWKTYRNDILSVSEVVWDSGTALRYIAWREVDKVFTRRKSLASSLYAKAVKTSSAGNAAEAATCCDWGLTLLEVLPEDTPAKASLQAIRKGLGNVKPAAVPGLSYVGREVDEIRKGLRIEHTGAAGEYDGPKALPFRAAQRDPRQRKHVQDAGIGHLIAHGKADQVEIPDGISALQRA